MKPNKILVLALAGLMLTVFGTGNVFAATWWTGTEHSQLTSSHSAEWVNPLISGTIYVPVNDYAAWFNELSNNDPSYSTINGQVIWTWGTQHSDSGSISYGSNWVPPEAVLVQNTGSQSVTSLYHGYYNNQGANFQIPSSQYQTLNLVGY